MFSTPPAMIVPLQTDEHGRIRVSGTRVTLDTVIHAFRQGKSPEQIVHSFDVLQLADVYAVIAYYLSHQDALDEYLRQQEADAQQHRQQLETQHPEMFTMQKKMRALREQQRKKDPR